MLWFFVVWFLPISLHVQIFIMVGQDIFTGNKYAIKIVSKKESSFFFAQYTYHLLKQYSYFDLNLNIHATTCPNDLNTSNQCEWDYEQHDNNASNEKPIANKTKHRKHTLFLTLRVS